MLYIARAIIKLINYYSLIQPEAKYKSIHGKGLPGLLTCIAKVSNCSHPSDLSSCLDVSSLKKMLQKLSIVLAQVKAGNTSNASNNILFVSRKRNS